MIGAALRTRKERKPVFVSPGDGIDLMTSIQIVLECTGQHRLPEPLRQAHLLANEIKETLRGSDQETHLRQTQTFKMRKT